MRVLQLNLEPIACVSGIQMLNSKLLIPFNFHPPSKIKVFIEGTQSGGQGLLMKSYRPRQNYGIVVKNVSEIGQYFTIIVQVGK